MSSSESEIINEQFMNAENQDQLSKNPTQSVEGAAIALSLYARYLWDIASALSREELRNEWLTVRTLSNNLAEAIERSN